MYSREADVLKDISERLEKKSKSKSKTREERTKSNGRRSEHKGISSNSEYGGDSKDTCEDLSMPYKRFKPTPFTIRITRFKYHRRAKLPRNIMVYKGNKDLKDHLGIFSADVEQEEWLMPIWCKIFCQTLSGAAWNQFDDLDLKRVDRFEELSHKFLEEFSQQKRVGRGSQSLAVGQMKCSYWMSGGQERIKGRNGPREFRRNLGKCAPYSRRDTFTPLTKTPKEILAMENKQLKEVVALRKLAHLVKDILQGNQRNRGQERRNVKVINMVARAKPDMHSGEAVMSKDKAGPESLVSCQVGLELKPQGKLLILDRVTSTLAPSIGPASQSIKGSKDGVGKVSRTKYREGSLEPRIRHKSKAEVVKSVVGRILWRSELPVRLDEKPRSRNIHDLRNDKVSYGKQDRNHSNQEGNSLRLPKDRGGTRTYSRREGHTSSNKSFKTLRSPKDGRNKRPEKQSLEEKRLEEAKLPQPPKVEITTDEKDE
uniref:Reverse transcriptase domain-containing protein n=1 Tax=Tanacetum cinerariifolium TaxID=118510 RepID=A0A699HLQ9_TANCI|nr:hypothetical protein [Tanacetum cinerariifolium]